MRRDKHQAPLTGQHTAGTAHHAAPPNDHPVLFYLSVGYAGMVVALCAVVGIQAVKAVYRITKRRITKP